MWRLGMVLLYSNRRQSLTQFLEDQPTAYLDEMQQYLFDSFDIDIATQSIGRYLRLSRWSRKVVKARAAEQSLPLRIRIAWQGCEHEWDEDQLVFSGKRTYCLHKMSSAELIGR
jgi:hypothetical protein